MQDEGSDALIARTVRAPSTRIFLIKFLSFQNGCFIIVAEDSNRIGSLYVSIASANKVSTAKVIPSKFDSIFINTISERISSMINGICLVCMHSVKHLHLDDMKAIMGEIMNLVGKEDEGNYNKQNQDFREEY
jgi:hypothetical protein